MSDKEIAAGQMWSSALGGRDLLGVDCPVVWPLRDPTSTASNFSSPSASVLPPPRGELGCLQILLRCLVNTFVFINGGSSHHSLLAGGIMYRQEDGSWA